MRRNLWECATRGQNHTRWTKWTDVPPLRGPCSGLLLLLALLVSQVDAPTPARSKVSQSSKHSKLAKHPTTEMDIETVTVGYHTYPARRPRA